MQVETLVIGDELLTGRISDTNSTYIGEKLFQSNIVVQRHTVIPDVIETIEKEILLAAERAEAVICFGGLGPTSDDRTAEAVAHLLKCELVDHEASKENLLRRLELMGRAVTPQALKQVKYPSALEAIPNSVGAAAGFMGKVGKCQFFFLPGVPEEMMAMFVETVDPKIKSQLKNTGVHHNVWSCYNIWESELQRLLDPVEANLTSDSWIGYRTSPPENHVTLYTKFKENSLEHKKLRDAMEEILKPHVFSRGEGTLEEIVLKLLAKKNMSLSFAESCTGGLCLQRMTQVAGSSKHIWGGYGVYQTRAKATMLGVKVASDDEAVSAQCTRDLAQATLKASQTDIAAAITGFMGPLGGSDKDPVGTVYLCVVDKKGMEERKINLPPRARIRLQGAAASHLIHLVRTRLLFV